MTKEISLEHVWVEFGEFTAVQKANLTIAGGEFFSFLGPSGCGKTTLLRCISGFQEPTRGVVKIGGKNMKGVGPNKRPTALIFQNLALFPLRSVADNIAFPLEVRGVDKKTRRKRADELLELIALTGQGDKKISELSGGQKQRVAIARALAVEPDILLLDEPLSALDLKLRQHMRTELRAIQKQVGLTFIYITHDQGEALTMSDRIAVMNKGKVEQIGDGKTIYDHPGTGFVASFVGENNVLEGTVLSNDGTIVKVDTGLGVPFVVANHATEKGALVPGDACQMFIRPEALRIAAGDDDRNRFECNFVTEEFEGNMRHIVLDASGRKLKMSMINDGRNPIDGSAPIALDFAPEMGIALPPGPLASA
ncbi:ABC transporter ATP-binding protein [Thalassospira alkalitolerans]|uniref:ABC transporter ATP-binding protein n=1 Tax=Thalassospira alkalitolerans TaxID=1293890 RepID=A0A1Y2LAR2_9PROT|nr:ABC transporter ATP-binding protein [Thalassospira alkalitolerans]OSQ47707.1 ABC transporter ATP-binding protein [Thalassospira alkalitolerans]|tara:strand:+ start:66611 stop:67708 length:1098 start_codon:yes stop_codon:yes gene_type:complete